MNYSESLKAAYEVFQDTFNLVDLPTRFLCYPISYIPSTHLAALEGRYSEEEQLFNASLQKDLPSFLQQHSEKLLVADGAAHIWQNRLKEPHYLLLGMPKSGKSMLLRKLTLLILDESEYTPVLIPLKEVFQNELNNFSEFIDACFALHKEHKNTLAAAFNSGTLVLLFDGLEDTGVQRELFIEWLVNLKSRLPFCVVTSRFSGYVPIPDFTVVQMQIFPLKLQVSMAQFLLSDGMYSQFIELATSGNSAYTEFSHTPYLLSHLMDLFRRNLIKRQVSKGSLLGLAVDSLLANATPEVRRNSELIAYELVARGSAQVTSLDARKAGVGNDWDQIKELPLFIKVEDTRPEKSSVEMITDDDCVQDSIDCEDGIGEIQETPSIRTRKQLFPDTTPQRMGSSKESFITYQIARSYIDKDFSLDKLDVYQVWNWPFIELLAARHICACIEDAVAQFPIQLMMETPTFQQVFGKHFPGNYLYSRKLREVVLTFGDICSPYIFENFLKYLLTQQTFENCSLVERLVRQRGNQSMYKPILNRVLQIRQGLVKKNFAKTFMHPAAIVRELGQYEATEAGLADISKTAFKQLTQFLKKSSWISLSQLTAFQGEIKENLLKPLFNVLIESTQDLLTDANQQMKHRYILQIFLTSLDTLYSKGRPTLDEVNAWGPSQKLSTVLLAAVHSCIDLDLPSVIKLLLMIEPSVHKIHSALAVRFVSLAGQCDSGEILKALKEMGFVNYSTIEITLLCLDEATEIKTKAKELLASLNVAKLRKHALKLLACGDTKPVRVKLALRTLGYLGESGRDEEILGLLAKFIDHHDLTARLEALRSLHKLLKNSEFITDDSVRSALAAVPHVLKDRLKLQKYTDTSLRTYSLKCLAVLWTVLDQGTSDQGCSQMLHVLVREQLSTSFVVGSLSEVWNIVWKFIKSSKEEESLAGWKALEIMNCVADIPQPSKAELALHIKGQLLENPHNRVLRVLISSDTYMKEYLKDTLLAILPAIALSSGESIANLLEKWDLIPPLIETLAMPDYLDESSLSSLHQFSLLNPHVPLLSVYFTEKLREYILPRAPVTESISEHTDCSQNSDQCDVAPRWCLELARHSPNTPELKEWFHHFMRRSDDSDAFFTACEGFGLLQPSREYYSPQVEGHLLQLLPNYLLQVAKSVVQMKFRSDCICLRLLRHVLETPVSHLSLIFEAIAQSMELTSASPLEELYKLLHTKTSVVVRTLALKVVERVSVTNDIKLGSCAMALCSTNSGIFVQKIWEYWMRRLAENPMYTLPCKVQVLLESTQSFNCQFLLRWARTLGLLKTEVPTDSSLNK